MNKLIEYTDRGLGCIVTLLGLLAVGFIVYGIFNLFAEVWSFLAYHLNYVLITVIITGISYIYYVHPSLKFKDNDHKQSRIRILLTLIGFLAIWLMYSFPQAFR